MLSVCYYTQLHSELEFSLHIVQHSRCYGDVSISNVSSKILQCWCEGSHIPALLSVPITRSPVGWSPGGRFMEPPYPMIWFWNVSIRCCLMFEILCGGVPSGWNDTFSSWCNGRVSNKYILQKLQVHLSRHSVANHYQTNVHVLHSVFSVGVCRVSFPTKLRVLYCFSNWLFSRIFHRLRDRTANSKICW